MTETRPPDPPDGGPAKKRRNGRNYQPAQFPSLFSPQIADHGQFMVVESLTENRKMDQLHPHVVKKFFERIYSSGWFSYKRQRDGKALVHVKSKAQAEKSIGKHTVDPTLNITVKIEKHSRMNQCKGKIYAPEYLDVSEEDIVKYLESEKVVGARKMLRKGTDGLRFTGIVVLTFDLIHLPESISVGMDRARVNQYYDNPLRCTKCQKYAHTKNHCKAENPVCRECSKDMPCEPCGPKKCVNCQGDHPSNAPQCPRRKEEEAIVRIMVDDSLSYPAAKSKYNRLAEQKEALSMAQVVQQRDRNPPAVTHEEFTELKLSFAVLRQELLESRRQIQIRDDLLAKHGITIPKEPEAVQESQSLASVGQQTSETPTTSNEVMEAEEEPEKAKKRAKKPKRNSKPVTLYKASGMITRKKAKEEKQSSEKLLVAAKKQLSSRTTEDDEIIISESNSEADTAPPKKVCIDTGGGKPLPPTNDTEHSL